MVSIPMPSAPSPLGGGYGVMKLQQAGLSQTFNNMFHSMGFPSTDHSNGPGNGSGGVMEAFKGFIDKFFTSGSTGQFDGSHLFGGITAKLGDMKLSAKQELSQITNVFLPAGTTKSLTDTVFATTDDPSNSQQAINNRTQQQAVPTGTTPRAPRPDAMG